MRESRRAAAAGFATAFALATIAPGMAAADETFPAGGTVADLAAGAGYVVWEHSVSGREGQTLSLRRAGVTQRLRVPLASNYAGVDVGTDSRGRPAAVFSRCGESTYSCDVFLYRFETRREVKVRSISKRRCDETGPSISKGVIAFSRGRRGSGRRARCRGGLYAKGRRRRARIRRLTKTVPLGTDLAGRYVAFSYDPDYATNQLRYGRNSEVGLARLGRKRRRVRRLTRGFSDRTLLRPFGCAMGCPEEILAQDQPSLDQGYVYWLAEAEGDNSDLAAVQRSRPTRRGFGGAAPLAYEDTGDSSSQNLPFVAYRGALYLQQPTRFIRRVDRPDFR